MTRKEDNAIDPVYKERLFLRAASLVCGIFGQTPGAPSERRTRVGGSALLVAPYLALTAKHVLQDLRKLHERPRPEPPGEISDYGAILFQVNPFHQELASGLWKADSKWELPWSDLGLLQVSPDAGGFPDGKVIVPASYFPWSVLPPPVGERVLMMGYPTTGATFIEGRLNVNIRFVLQGATVVAIHSPRRDSVLFNFPCFEVDRGVDGGFSGGAVFWNATLCGLVSGGDSDRTYAASLWPLCLMDYGYPGMPGKTRFGNMLDDGHIRSADWGAVKARISKHTDEQGLTTVLIDPE